MAKMFYTLEEAAGKLGVSQDQVREMASSGQLQEFRDRDRLMFKVEQVDLLSKTDDDAGPASGGDSGDFIQLADSGAGLGLAPEESGSPAAKSGSGPSLAAESPKERSGIAIFDSDETDDSDPLAATRITSSPVSAGGGGGGGGRDSGASGSGSGLLDLTRESDDTSLGAGLLENVYADDQGEQASSGGGSGGASGGLFESTGAASDVTPAALGAGAMLMMAAEPYDGPWSGIAGGLAFAMCAVLGVLLSVTVLGLLGMSGGPIIAFVSANFMPAVGGIVGLLAVSAVVGWVLGRKS